MEIIQTRIKFLALLLITSVASYAQTIIEGICYKFDSKKLEATIISSNNVPKSQKSSIDIPSEVKYENITYKVTTIASEAFRYRTDITSINIPNSVLYIGSGAFMECTNLSSITLPNTITRIEPKTFWLCSNLVSITIPEGVKTISDYAFNNCDALTSIVLPSTIEHISSGAFDETNPLKSVTVNSPTPITIYSNTFMVFGELHVPAGSKEAYSKAPIWKNFTIIEDTETETTGIAQLSSITQQPTSVFNLSGQSLTAPRKGLNIINGKKVIVK